MSWLSRIFGKEKDVHEPSVPRAAATAHVAVAPEPPVVEEYGVYNHPPFDEEVRDVLREIKMSLDEVFCLSLEEWEDRFRREPDTIRAIASYVVIARVYQQLTSEGRHDKNRKRDIYHVLAACPLYPSDQVLSQVQLTAITAEEARAAIHAYHSIGPQRPH